MSWILVEFLCTQHEDGRFESLEHRPPPDTSTCPHCGADAERVISAPYGTTPIATVVRGQVAPPPNPYATDLTAVGRKEIGWGTYHERRDKQLADLRHKEVKEKMKR